MHSDFLAQQQCSEILSYFKHMQLIAQLTQPSAPSIHKLLSLVKKISPDVLIDIIEYRKLHKLPDLPFCERIHPLLEYYPIIKQANTHCSKQEIAAILASQKKRAQWTWREQAAMELYVNNHAWFLGYIKFQQKINTRLRQYCKHILTMILKELVWKLSVALIAASIIIMLAILIFAGVCYWAVCSAPTAIQVIITSSLELFVPITYCIFNSDSLLAKISLTLLLAPGLLLIAPVVLIILASLVVYRITNEYIALFLNTIKKISDNIQDFSKDWQLKDDVQVNIKQG